MPRSTHPKTCGNCAHRVLDADDKMTRLGFGRCAHLRRWQHLADWADCRIPTRYQEIAR